MTDPTDPARPSSAPSRREVLVYSGAGLTGFLWRQERAGSASDVFPIPAEKDLDPAWRRSLVERGEPFVARGRELRWIGMPVGGIGCGQVYLGGDGKLWLWDVQNQPRPPGFDSRAGPHYEHPLERVAPFDLAFALQVERRGGGTRLGFNASGFEEIEFRGTYPIGTVTYRSRNPALEVELEAFSPFVPLELEASSLPAIVLRYRLRNPGSQPLTLRLLGNLDNPVARSAEAEEPGEILRTTYEVREEDLGMLVHHAERRHSAARRPDILFEDFERPDYTGWTVAGMAFGPGPSAAAPSVGAEGERYASSYRAPVGEEASAANASEGTLTSREFVIERSWINFLLGGGAHPEGTGIELLIDGRVVASASGRNDRRLRPHSFYVASLQGQRAQLRITDRITGEWGSVSVDSIVFSDRRAGEALEERGDFGTMALAVLGPGSEAELALAAASPQGEHDPAVSERGTAGRRLELAPGGEGEVVFVVAWHFPNPERERLLDLPDGAGRKRHYASVFPGAETVARFVAREHARLARATRAWRDAWYDSTLPYWLLDRTFAGAATLATSTCLRLDDGRLHSTGVATCCPASTHAWQHAQAPARLFPALERAQRERIDLELAFHEDTGRIGASGASGLALDAQAGAILCLWREHTCSADDAYLRRVYPRAKKALECLLARGADQDGLLAGPQHDAHGAAWSGAVPGLSSLVLAAVRAGEAMATEMGDADFAVRCRAEREAGAQSFVRRLFDGESFVQDLDPAGPGERATGKGCAIDQVLGQAWAHQLGLGRVLPERETRAALAAQWKYAFATDVGPYRQYMRERIPGGRWFAMPGEAGTLTCTWPKGGHEVAAGAGKDSGASTFNECQTGLEHELAAHMLWEGMVEKGLALERAVHDRYHPAKRNPYNEVEGGDHSAGAMASYGVYLAACGFELHGPEGHLGFAPRIGPDYFRAAFTAAEGWGTYTQEIDAEKQLRALIELRFGRLRLRTLRLGHAGLAAASTAVVRLGERELACRLEKELISFHLRFAEDVLVEAGQALAIECRT